MHAGSWLDIPPQSDFSIANIPFGIISTISSPDRRPAIAIGNQVLDLKVFAAQDGFRGLPGIQQHLDVFTQPTLNAFAALGRPVHRGVRQYLQEILSKDTSFPALLKDNTPLRKDALIPSEYVRMHLPMHIGDYTDFFAGINHAFNVGTLFRGPANALQPNYTHIPVGYHGRASSVVVSSTPIRRPLGQVILDPIAVPQVVSRAYHDVGTCRDMSRVGIPSSICLHLINSCSQPSQHADDWTSS
jgi:fumarylacetoacetase